MNNTVPAEGWFKSSYSPDDNAGCVEVRLGPDAVGLRDTKDRSIPAHTYSPAAWEGLLAGIESGEFALGSA